MQYKQNALGRGGLSSFVPCGWRVHFVFIKTFPFDKKRPKLHNLGLFYLLFQNLMVLVPKSKIVEYPELEWSLGLDFFQVECRNDAKNYLRFSTQKQNKMSFDTCRTALMELSAKIIRKDSSYFEIKVEDYSQLHYLLYSHLFSNFLSAFTYN